MPNAVVPHEEHYDNGKVKLRGAHLAGEMHGPWEFFRKDGSMMRSGTLDRGRQVGVWRTYDRAGRIVKETDFGDG
ncbi:MAG: toxin-antitoxin system YwqK family antitoxin [Chloroflexota bacterium]